MAVLDPTTSLGKIRLRIGDWHDLVILPDSVIQSALTDCQNNVPRASALCAQYILATLTFKTHRKMAQLETWTNEQFEHYVDFLKLTVLNPHMMATSPVPYAPQDQSKNPLITFMDEWNKEYIGPDYSSNRILDVTNGSM